MPNRLDPYDFSDMQISPYDFSDMPRGVPPGSRLNDPLARAFVDSGLVKPESVDPVYGFQAETPGTTRTAGTGAQTATSKEGFPLQNPLVVFVEKLKELNKNVALHRSGLTAPIAALGAAGKTVSDVISFGKEYDPDQSAIETGAGLISNTFRSVANLYPALAELPEAMVRNPSGTLESMLEFIPHQAITVWKAVAPAKTRAEKRQQKAARLELYEDPLGPVFAATMAGGLLKMSARVASKYRAAAEIAKLEEKAGAGFARAQSAETSAIHEQVVAGRASKQFGEDVAGISREQIAGREAANLEARKVPSPRPNVPTRALSTSVEQPPAGPITDPSRLIGMTGPAGEVMGPGGSFQTWPSSRSRRIPEERAVEGAFGGKEFSETAIPGGGEIRPFEGQVPARMMGTAPEGNYMDFINRLKGANGADVTSGRPPKPPRYQPWLRSNAFSESKILDEKFKKPAEPTVLESAHPQTVVPEVASTPAAMAKVDTPGWMRRRIARQQRIFAIMNQFGKRLVTPQGKQLVREMQAMSRETDQLTGNLAEDFREVGALLQRPGPVSAIARKVKGVVKQTTEEFMAQPAVRAIYQKIGGMLKEAGVTLTNKDGELTPFNLSEDFLKTGPYRWKIDIAQKIWDDVGGAVDIARAHAESVGHGKNAGWIDNYLTITRESMGKMSKATEEGIAALMDAKVAKTPGQALRMLAEESSSQLFRRTGVEFSRNVKMPESFRETNPAILTARYIGEAARTLAEVKQFGPAREGLRSLLEEIEKVNAKEGGMARDLADVMMGVVDRTHPITPAARRAQKVWANVTYGVKIGAGFAPFIQVTQPLISVIPDAGITRFVRGTLKAMSPEERALLRRQGVAGHSAFQKMMGTYGSSGVWSYVPTTQFFSWANRVLDYTTAATGEVFVRDLHRIANTEAMTAPGALRVKWAQSKLKERFDIDYKQPIDDAAFVKATRDYAHQLQLHPDATVEPRFMNMPSTRWLATLKRFVYKQTILTRDMIWQDFKHGNLAPAIRLAAGGLLGGDLALRGRDRIQEMITGKHVFREDDPLWQAIANRLAVVGTFGMISDVGWLNPENPAMVLGEAAAEIGFSATPVFASDVMRVGEMGVEQLEAVGKEAFGTKKEKEQKDWPKHLQDFSADAVSILGTYGYYVSQQMRSDIDEGKRNEYVYKQRLSLARRAYWGGDHQRAWAIVGEWNKYASQYPLMDDRRQLRAVKKIERGQVEDIDVKETYER